MGKPEIEQVPRMPGDTRDSRICLPSRACECKEVGAGRWSAQCVALVRLCLGVFIPRSIFDISIYVYLQQSVCCFKSKLVGCIYRHNPDFFVVFFVKY